MGALQRDALDARSSACGTSEVPLAKAASSGVNADFSSRLSEAQTGRHSVAALRSLHCAIRLDSQPRASFTRGRVADVL